jgi:hypothetical protein
MKNLVSKLLPLVDKFKGKKPIVIILSVVAIAAGLFAVQKGYITEESLNFETIINVVGDAFATTPIDSVVAPVEPIDTLAIEVVVDSVITQ